MIEHFLNLPPEKAKRHKAPHRHKGRCGAAVEPAVRVYPPELIQGMHAELSAGPIPPTLCIFTEFGIYELINPKKGED